MTTVKVSPRDDYLYALAFRVYAVEGNLGTRADSAFDRSDSLFLFGRTTADESVAVRVIGFRGYVGVVLTSSAVNILKTAFNDDLVLLKRCLNCKLRGVPLLRDVRGVWQTPPPPWDRKHPFRDVDQGVGIAVERCRISRDRGLYVGFLPHDILEISVREIDLDHSFARGHLAKELHQFFDDRGVLCELTNFADTGALQFVAVTGLGGGDILMFTDRALPGGGEEEDDYDRVNDDYFFRTPTCDLYPANAEPDSFCGRRIINTARKFTCGFRRLRRLDDKNETMPDIRFRYAFFDIEAVSDKWCVPEGDAAAKKLAVANNKMVDAASDPIVQISVVYVDAQNVPAYHVFGYAPIEWPDDDDGKPALADIVVHDRYADELQMLRGFERFVTRVADVDGFSGYNVRGFDHPYLQERIEKLGQTLHLGRSTKADRVYKHRFVGGRPKTSIFIKGRFTFDLLNYILLNDNQKSNKLADVAARHRLPVAKIPIPYYALPALYQTAHGRGSIARYCVRDSELVRLLNDKTGYADYLCAIASIAKAPVATLCEECGIQRPLTYMFATEIARQRRYANDYVGYCAARGFDCHEPKDIKAAKLRVCVRFYEDAAACVQAMLDTAAAKDSTRARAAHARLAPLVAGAEITVCAPRRLQWSECVVDVIEPESTGGLVLIPQPGYYLVGGGVDYRSLYPSMTVSVGIGPTRLLEHADLEDPRVVALVATAAAVAPGPPMGLASWTDPLNPNRIVYIARPDILSPARCESGRTRGVCVLLNERCMDSRLAERKLLTAAQSRLMAVAGAESAQRTHLQGIVAKHQAQQLGLKLLGNSTYGALGSGRISPYSCYLCARLITSAGRIALGVARKTTLEVMREKAAAVSAAADLKIVMGDTDSIAIGSNALGLSAIVEILYEIERRTNEFWRRCRMPRTEIVVENAFSPAIITAAKKLNIMLTYPAVLERDLRSQHLLPSATATVAPNRVAVGARKPGTVKYTGLGIKKSPSTPLLCETQAGLLTTLLETAYDRVAVATVCYFTNIRRRMIAGEYALTRYLLTARAPAMVENDDYVPKLPHHRVAYEMVTRRDPYAPKPGERFLYCVVDNFWLAASLANANARVKGEHLASAVEYLPGGGAGAGTRLSNKKLVARHISEAVREVALPNIEYYYRKEVLSPNKRLIVAVLGAEFYARLERDGVQPGELYALHERADGGVATCLLCSHPVVGADLLCTRCRNTIAKRDLIVGVDENNPARGPLIRSNVYVRPGVSRAAAAAAQFEVAGARPLPGWSVRTDNPRQRWINAKTQCASCTYKIAESLRDKCDIFECPVLSERYAATRLGDRVNYELDRLAKALLLPRLNICAIDLSW